MDIYSDRPIGGHDQHPDIAGLRYERDDAPVPRLRYRRLRKVDDNIRIADWDIEDLER